MAKTTLYLASRNPRRLEKPVIANALEHFTSTGDFLGSSDLAVEVFNHALEQGWAASITPHGKGLQKSDRWGLVRVQRI